jgi:hypothetical protein
MRRSQLTFAALLAVTTLLMSATLVGAVGGRTFVIPLSGADPEGTGTAVIRVNPGTQEVCYTINVSGIGTPTEPAAGLGAAHIHDVATGGIFVDLETNWTATATGFMTSGCTTADREDLIALLLDPSAYYVNIHTTEFPTGAIQGSLG